MVSHRGREKMTRTHSPRGNIFSSAKVPRPVLALPYVTTPPCATIYRLPDFRLQSCLCQEARKTGAGPVSPALLPTCCVTHGKVTSLLRLFPDLSPQDLCMHYTLSLECPCSQ